MGRKTEAGVHLVRPVVHPEVRLLCRRPYLGHARGCPNWGRRPTCPPAAPLITESLDLSRAVFCVYNAFDLAAHVRRMRALHPEWSERQLHCCLYWQAGARKQLQCRMHEFLLTHPGLVLVYVPEACGVDVTATMASLGVTLEWPPMHLAYQVALAGTPHGGRRQG